MRYMPARPDPLPEPQARLIAEWGERLRLARLRRRLSAEATAVAAGITRATLHRAERGEPAITLGTFVKLMGVMGLDGDVALLARDDPAGRLLQDQQLPRRRAATPPPRRRLPRRGRVRLADYPQLRQLAWHLAPEVQELTPEEAFALYERHWRHVDAQALDEAERQLLRELTATVGRGVMLV